MQGKVEICGVNTSKLPTIPHEKTLELFRRMQAGSKEARTELIEGNLRLVLSVIQRFSGRGENADDLFQVGCIGLIKSIDNFDLSQNVRFSTYAVPMIIGEIRRYLRDTAYKALQVRGRLAAARAEEPTVEEIAREMDVSRSEVVFALDAIQDPISLFEPVYHDGGDAVSVMDQVRDDKNEDEVWLEGIALQDAIDRLPPREKTIVELRFFKGKTQMEVSGELGISQAQVSRLEKTAIKNIRRFYL